MSLPWVWDTGYRNKLQYYVNHSPMADGGGRGSYSGNRPNLTWRGFEAALYGKIGGDWLCDKLRGMVHYTKIEMAGYEII